MTRETISFTNKTDSVDDVLAAHINTLQNYLAKVWNTFGFVGATELTISSGAVTVAGNYHTIDTEGDAASDDLESISLGTDIEEASLLIFRPDNDARTVVVKHDVGNILCVGGADFTLDDEEDFCVAIYDAGLAKWLVMFGGGGSIEPSICNGRLTLESGVPVSTTNQSAKTTVYFTPFRGNVVSLYNTTLGKWIRHTFTELSLSLSGYTANKNYDIWLYDNAGTPTLASTVWTDNSTRATALTTQDGVYVKTGALNYRYLGTIRINSTGGQCEDTLTQRFVWNYYNQVPRKLYTAESTTHTYATATFRKWNNSDINNKTEFVVGMQCNEYICASSPFKAGTSGDNTQVRLYLDGATVSLTGIQNHNAYTVQSTTNYIHLYTIGYHHWQMYEYCAASAGGGTFYSMYISGELHG